MYSVMCYVYLLLYKYMCKLYMNYLNDMWIFIVYFRVTVLVEKDQKPSWNPPTIYKVDDQHIEHYFSPLSPDRELTL